MNKYQLLQNYLTLLKVDAWEAQFKDIENIIGLSLPKSAYIYPAWWANQEYSVQCRSWMNVGWVTSKLDLAKNRVTFSKNNIIPPKTAKFRSRESALTTQNTLHAWDKQQTISSSLTMEWKPVGKVELTKNNRLMLPHADQIPALYRFRILENGKESLYIGETINLQQRFGNYKCGSKGQVTNHRIKNSLVSALQGGAEISVSIITEKAFIDKGDGLVPLDLSSKVARCYLENAAIIHGSAVGIETLNKANV